MGYFCRVYFAKIVLTAFLFSNSIYCGGRSKKKQYCCRTVESVVVKPKAIFKRPADKEKVHSKKLSKNNYSNKKSESLPLKRQKYVSTKPPETLKNKTARGLTATAINELFKYPLEQLTQRGLIATDINELFKYPLEQLTQERKKWRSASKDWGELHRILKTNRFVKRVTHDKIDMKTLGKESNVKGRFVEYMQIQCKGLSDVTSYNVVNNHYLAAIDNKKMLNYVVKYHDNNMQSSCKDKIALPRTVSTRYSDKLAREIKKDLTLKDKARLSRYSLEQLTETLERCRTITGDWARLYTSLNAGQFNDRPEIKKFVDSMDKKYKMHSRHPEERPYVDKNYLKALDNEKIIKDVVNNKQRKILQ